MVHDHSAVEEDLELLTKIFRAVNLSIEDDVCQIRLNASDSISVQELTAGSDQPTLVLFGIQPGQLGFQIDLPLYQPHPLAHFQILSANSLSEIRMNKTYKAALWDALQQMWKQ